MLKNCIPFELPGFCISHVEEGHGQLTIYAKTQNLQAVCPVCQTITAHVHSNYKRAPQDLPVSGKMVHLVLGVRRFYWWNEDCSQKIFCERIPQVVAVHAQRSTRLSSTLENIGLALCGHAGARYSCRLGMPTSASTLLRKLRCIELPVPATPRVLGVDDFALRRGRIYGTLLVDGETHRPIDLIQERSAEALYTWLKAHPAIEIITRDRSTEYARGATRGDPDARQVADRWHLLVNLREA